MKQFLTLLACVTLAGTAAHAAAPPPAAPDLTPRLARIADRIASIDAQATRIGDYNEIRNLQRIYGFYYDEALWDQVVDLFAEKVAATQKVEIANMQKMLEDMGAPPVKDEPSMDGMDMGEDHHHGG